MSLVARSDDCEVNCSDLETLKPLHCVNDTIIHFFSNIMNKKFNNSIKKLYFVNPSLTQFIQTSKADVSKDILLENPQAENSSYIFFPLSNLQTNCDGHWSLLLLYKSKTKNLFLHFDSLKNKNFTYAKSLAQKIAQIYQMKHYDFSNMKAPIQKNEYDCGIYTMAIMNEIAIKMTISKELLTKISPEFIDNFRACFSQFIIGYNQRDIDWIQFYLSIHT